MKTYVEKSPSGLFDSDQAGLAPHDQFEGMTRDNLLFYLSLCWLVLIAGAIGYAIGRGGKTGGSPT